MREPSSIRDQQSNRKSLILSGRPWNAPFEEGTVSARVIVSALAEFGRTQELASIQPLVGGDRWITRHAPGDRSVIITYID
jgi:hypothetical protein